MNDYFENRFGAQNVLNEIWLSNRIRIDCVFGCCEKADSEIIRFESVRTELDFESCNQFLSASNTRHSAYTAQPTLEIMSAPCRISAGLSRTLEITAAPRIARRTFATRSANLTSTSSVTTRGGLKCLREAERSAIGAGKLTSASRAQTRSFTQSASRSKLKTIDQIRARNRGGVCHLVCSAYMREAHIVVIQVTNSKSSHSILQPRSSSLFPAPGYGRTSRTRRSAWRGKG
jgi:hypothetical protein